MVAPSEAASGGTRAGEPLHVACRSPLGNLGRKAPDSNRSRWLGGHKGCQTRPAPHRFTFRTVDSPSQRQRGGRREVKKLHLFACRLTTPEHATASLRPCFSAVRARLRSSVSA